MQVCCSKCGEELIGAVNRCWRCGQMFRHTTDEDARPPVRRAPVILDAPEGDVVAVAVESPAQRAQVSNVAADEPDESPPSWRAKVPRVCAYASAVIGGIGCLTGWFLWWTMFPVVVGIVLGILAVNSDRRDIALTGIVLCGIALFASSVHAAYTLFSIYWGQQLIDSF